MNTEHELFNKSLGCIIANMLSVEYNEFMQVTFLESGNKYLANKCRDAYKAEQKVIDKLKVVDKDVREMIEKIIEFNSDLIFDIIALEEPHQKRVRGLVDKIKKEEKLKQLV